MKSVFRLLAALTGLFGLAVASAPSHAISVVGNLGWQAVPATCAVASNVHFNLADRKLHFQCGPTSVQFACSPAAAIAYNPVDQRVSIACVSNTITAIASTWSPSPGGPAVSCTMNDFDFNVQERTVSFACTNSPSQRRICYSSNVPPAPDYVTGSVDFGYCPDAAFELVGHSGFEEGELWRPTFGQAP